jgi:DNA-binding transcriptional regulator YhcF (GntR family)
MQVCLYRYIRTVRDELQAIEPLGLEMALDRDAEIPIGTQLAWAVRTRVRDGTFKPGERLPGLRELAEAAGVNVNTVRAVYQRLENEGLIEGQQGTGTFVAPTPQRPSAVGTIAANAAREAEETGVDPRDVAAALYVSRPDVASPASGGVERRRLLREQIASLERTLSELEAQYPGLVSPSTKANRRGGPALLGATELEDVRTLLVRRLGSVQEAIDELGAEGPVGEEEGQPQPVSKSGAQHGRGPGRRRQGREGVVVLVSADARERLITAKTHVAAG